jgi:hypothetical protein
LFELGNAPFGSEAVFSTPMLSYESDMRVPSNAVHLGLAMLCAGAISASGGCGGGSSGSSETLVPPTINPPQIVSPSPDPPQVVPPAPNPPQVVRYVYVTGQGLSIVLVDPAKPDKQIVVEPPNALVTPATALYAGTYDPATKRVTGLRQTNLIYAKGNTVYRLPLESSTGTPTPIPVASLSARPCPGLGRDQIGIDYARAENTRISIPLARAGFNCFGGISDTFVELFPLRTNPAGRSAALSGPYVYSATDGSVAGQISISSSGEVRYFPGEQVEGLVVGVLPNHSPSRYRHATAPGSLLLYPDSESGTVFLFTATDRTLKSLTLAPNGGGLILGVSAVDGQAYYVHTRAPATADNIWRVPFTGSAPTAVYTAPDVSSSLGAAVTGSRLVVVANDFTVTPARSKVLLLSKEGGTASVVYDDPQRVATVVATGPTTFAIEASDAFGGQNLNILLNETGATLASFPDALIAWLGTQARTGIPGWTADGYLIAAPGYFVRFDPGATLSAVSNQTGRATRLGTLPPRPADGGTGVYAVEAFPQDGQVGNMLGVRAELYEFRSGTRRLQSTTLYSVDIAKQDSLTELKP